MKANKLIPVFLFIPLCLWAQVSPAEAPVSAAALWEREINDTVLGLPFLQAESVVIAGDNGSVKSWSMSGTHLWDFDPHGKVSPHSSRSIEGATYVSNVSGLFMAVNRVGRELWRLDLGRPMSFPAVVGWDGRLFIAVDSNIYCRTASGLPLWNLNLGSNVAMAPVLDHAGGIVTYLANRDFIRISHLGVIERLRLDREPAIIVPLLNHGSSPGISATGDSYLLLYQNGEAENIRLDFSASRGAGLSRTSLPSLPGQPIAAAGYEDLAAITLRDGRVFLISGVTGQVQWNGNSHETVSERGTGNLNPSDANMIFDERGIYTLSRIGATCFTVEGKRRWLFRLPQTSTILTLSSEGLIYACGRDGMLRVYKVDNRVRQIPRSMYGPDPEGTYGLSNPPSTHWLTDSFRFDERIIRSMYDEIEAATRSGQIGENEPYYVAYLMEMIGFFLTNPTASLVRAPVKVPERIDFIRLLARMGSRETINFLVTIYHRDPEPSIKAACLEAIGQIGVDPKGEAIAAYTFLLSRDNANRDSQLLLSATDSIAALVRFSGPPLAADGILLLTQFARYPDFRPDVRARAQVQLDALRREGLDRVIF
jgi:outer membrane protein assembly factor BamB